MKITPTQLEPGSFERAIGNFSLPAREGVVSPERSAKRPGKAGMRKFVAAVAITGAFLGSTFAVSKSGMIGGKGYSQTELRQLPQEAETVLPGTGAEKAIANVDTNLDAATRSAIDQFVGNQGTHGNLLPGQTVEVPVIPGHEVKH